MAEPSAFALSKLLSELIGRKVTFSVAHAAPEGVIKQIYGIYKVLPQVMQRLQNINEVGRGIAVAFVATIYGVGAANLFFLPCAGRIRSLMQRKQVLRELVLEGVVAILDKTTPRALEKKLAVYRHKPLPSPIAPVVVQ